MPIGRFIATGAYPIAAILYGLGAGQALAFMPEDELNQRAFSANQAAMQLRSGDLDTADKIMTTERKPPFFETHSGYPYLATLYEGYAQAVDEAASTAEIDEIEANARQFAQKAIGSPSAPIVLADVLLACAIRERGDSAATSNEADAHLKAARGLLETAKKTASKDPHWYTLMVRIGAQQKWDRPALMAIVEEAARRYPDYSPTYLAMTEQIATESNPAAATELETFARRITQLTKPAIGTQAYATIYLHATQTFYGWRMMQQSHVVWADLKQSMAELAKAHPFNDWFSSYAAMFACEAGDQEEAAKRVKDVELQGFAPPAWIWGNAANFEACRNWAGNRAIAKWPLPADPNAGILQTTRVLVPDKSKMLSMDYEQSVRARDRNDGLTGLLNEGFVSLEHTAQRLRDGNLTTPSGHSRLARFYEGVATMLPPDGGPNDLVLQKVESYLTKYPNSPTPIVMKASLMIQRAWNIRTNAFASKVSPDQWRAFKERIDEAGAFLISHKEVGSRDPEWYVHMARVARDQQWERPAYISLLDEGETRYPKYFRIYDQGDIGMMPQWGGSAADIDNYINHALEHADPADHDMFYAWMYGTAEDNYYTDDNLFKDSRANWPRMLRGLKAALAKYPGTWNENELAYYACRAGDLDTARKAFQTLDAHNEKIERPEWKEAFFQQCRAWVAAAPPSVWDDLRKIAVPQ